jgi:hypothetical protein
VRVLLDECVPARLARDLEGHDVSTVTRIGLAGTPDGELLLQIATTFDVLLTVDQSLEFQQSPSHRIALVTIVSRSISYSALKPYTAKILATLRQIAPGDRVRIDSPD